MIDLRRKLSARTGFCFIVMLFLFGFQTASAAQEVFILEMTGTIGPASASYVERGIQKAEESQATCCIILMDTPGGLAEAMRAIVKEILASRVPVVVYVAPSGARAASAGVMITMAADVAVMAPGTNIGAAHPVSVIPLPEPVEDATQTMVEKMVNDIVANARSVAEQKGRNPDWVEKAIRENVSITETQAVEKNVVDFIAKNQDELLAMLDGKEIPDKGTIKTKGAAITHFRENLRERLLQILGNPNWAFIFFLLGLAGLYFEFTNPGALLPGIMGGISLILALYSFSLLPVNYVGVLLIILAAILFVLEIKITSHGALSIGGVVAMVLGAIMLFDYEATGIRVAWGVLIPTVAFISAFFIIVASLVVKAHQTKPATGKAGIVGETGKVLSITDPGRGKVHVHAEIWNAKFQEPVTPGDPVRVTEVDGLLLTVEKIIQE